MTPTHIRTLFLHPKPTYAIGEAATLLEMDWRDLRGWMETGEVEGIHRPTTAGRTALCRATGPLPARAWSGRARKVALSRRPPARYQAMLTRQFHAGSRLPSTSEWIGEQAVKA
jgi:hypothetical protein